MTSAKSHLLCRTFIGSGDEDLPIFGGQCSLPQSPCSPSMVVLTAVQKLFLISVCYHSKFPTLFSSSITEKMVFTLIGLYSVHEIWTQYRHKHEIAWWHSAIRWPFQWPMHVSVCCLRLSHFSAHSISLVYLSHHHGDLAPSSLSFDFPHRKDLIGWPWSILRGHLLWKELSWQTP